MYEEPSTRKTWSPFFSGLASTAGALDSLRFSDFAAGMGGMWAVRAPLATPAAPGSVDKRYSAGCRTRRFFGASQNRSDRSNRKRRKVQRTAQNQASEPMTPATVTMIE